MVVAILGLRFVLVSLLFVFVIFLFIAAGDEMLRGLLVECAHHILGRLGPDTDLKRWGLKLAERGGKAAKKRAVVAMARKLSVLLLHLWATGEIYEPLRNAKKRGELLPTPT